MSEESTYQPQYSNDDIPDSDAPPQSGGSDGLWFQLDGELKCFKFKPKGATEYTHTPHLKGIWYDTAVWWDADGNPSRDIQPGWRLSLYLQTKEFGIVQLRIGSKAGFSSAVKTLQAVAKGSVVDLVAAPFNKGCFINGSLWTGTAWMELRGAPLGGATPEENYLRAIDLIRTHETYNKDKSDAAPHTRSRARQPKGEQTRAMGPEQSRFIATAAEAGWPPFAVHAGEYEAWFKRVMNDGLWTLADANEATWASFTPYILKIMAAGADLPRELRAAAQSAYDPLNDDATPAPAPTVAGGGYQAQVGVTATPAPVQPSAQPTPTAAVATSANVHERGEPIATIDSAAWASIGYVPSRIPSPGAVAAPSTLDQRAALAKAAFGKFPTGRRAGAFDKLLAGFGLKQPQFQSGGALMLCSDFVKVGTPEQLASMTVGVENDPFEDQ